MMSCKLSVVRKLWFQQSQFQIRKMCKDLTIKKPILYGDVASPPTRFVMITAEHLGVDIHLHNIDLFEGQHKTDEYKKVNALEKVPALTIDGQTISDSHAIATYLCRSTENQDLYCTDNLMRAKVDQMLYFDATTLFPIDSTIFGEYFAGKWPADETRVTQWYSAVDYLELHLNNHQWLVGDKMQLCDICCAITVRSLCLLFPLLDKHIRVREWLKRLDELPYFDINKRGLDRMQIFVEKFGPAIVQST